MALDLHVRLALALALVIRRQDPIMRVINFIESSLDREGSSDLTLAA
jgi:hypothetical protein